MKRRLDRSKAKEQKSKVATPRAAAGLDAEFKALMAFLAQRSDTEIFGAVKHNLAYFEGKDKQNYDATINYYNKYMLWGAYYPTAGVWELAQNRAEAFSQHREDFEWLYGRLGDYRSKRVLHNILSYWLTCDYAKIVALRDKYFKQYFDLDLIACDDNEVFVDIGAYIGDTMVDYVKTFGDRCYKRIYCYEVVPEKCAVHPPQYRAVSS